MSEHQLCEAWKALKRLCGVQNLAVQAKSLRASEELKSECHVTRPDKAMWMMPDHICTHHTNNGKCDLDSLSGCMLVLPLASAIDEDGRSRRSGTALPVRSEAR